MKTIVICNLKGGMAKTTTVINMAAILTKDYKKRVLVIDADMTGKRKFSVMRYSGCWFTRSELQAVADGDFEGMSTHHNFLDAISEHERLRELAQALHCSADYIIGQTDEPKVYYGEKS